MDSYNSERLVAKDFITIGIYSVLIRVIGMVVSIPLWPFMYVTFPIMAGVSVLATAPIYLLMAYKVGKRGVMFLFCTIIGLTGAMLGYVYMIPYMLVAGVVCEAVMWKKGSYRRFSLNIVSYSLFSVFWLGGTYLPIYIFGKEYFAQMDSTKEYADTFEMYATSATWIIIAILITVLMASIGCLIGRRFLKKHFIKSGLIQESNSKTEAS